MEGFVFDLQRFAVFTITSDIINADNVGKGIYLDTSGAIRYANDPGDSRCFAKIVSAPNGTNPGEIWVTKYNQIKLSFVANDTNSYKITCVHDISLETPEQYAYVIIKGSGAATTAGNEARTLFNGNDGEYPVVSVAEGLYPVVSVLDANYCSRFTLTSVHNSTTMDFSIQKSYNGSQFVAAKGYNLDFVAGGLTSYSLNTQLQRSDFSTAPMSLADVCAAAVAVGYSGQVYLYDIDGNNNSKWNSTPRGQSTVYGEVSSNNFTFTNNCGAITLPVGAGTIGDVTFVNGQPTLDASNTSAKTGTITMANGAKVKDKDNVVWTAGVNSSTSSVSGGVMTLKSGTFTGNGSANIDASANMIVNNTTFISGAEGSFTYNSAGNTIALTSGDALVGTSSNVTTVTASGVTYTVGKNATTAAFTASSKTVTNFNAGTISFTAADNTSYAIGNQTIADGNGKTVAFKSIGSNAPYLYSTSGAITLGADKSIAVSDSAGSNTSAIKAGAGGSIDLAVADGKYTISDLNNGEKVTIDGVEYTYTYNATDGGRLMNGNVGWEIDSSHIAEGVATVQFAIADNTTTQSDTIVDGYGEAVGPGLKENLAEIIEDMTTPATIYFGKNGTQLAGTSGAYKLVYDGSTYKLTSENSANTGIEIDLAGVPENLSIDLSAGSGTEVLKLGTSTTLAGLKLGTGDSVVSSDGNTKLAQAFSSGATATVNESVVTLTGGSYVGVGEHNIDATSADVTIDGVTFNQGAKGTFTNGETDTFEVTSGTATVDAVFSGTATAAGVAYTVAAGTVATFSADTPKNVTGFTAGKITLTAANETTYNIGNQTIKDGNGATLTFVPTGLCSTGEGNISLGAGDSITVSNESGTNTKQIAAATGSAIDVAVANGKYTISDLDNGEQVVIDGKTYLYRSSTGFLEELDNGAGTGKGYRISPVGDNATISFDSSTGELDIATAAELPGTMAGDAGQFAIVCSLVEENLPFQFKADGTRAVGNDPVAYTLTKSASGYTLTSTENADTNITLDTSGLIGLLVNLTAGEGAQTVKVDSATALSSGSKLGAGDKLKKGDTILLTAGSEVPLTKEVGKDCVFDLTGNQSVTVSGTNGDTSIQPVSGNGVQVTVSDSKYTLSGLDDGERLSIGGKTYLYRADTKFLEEYNATYTDGTGDGYILTNSGTITFNSNGTLDTNTAMAMPATLDGADALGIICHAVAVGSTYTFKADGTRAYTADETAYTLTKSASGYTLTSTDKATSSITLDASGLTGLTVNLTAGTGGAQTLLVTESTALASGSKLGEGDQVKKGDKIILTAGSEMSLTKDAGGDCQVGLTSGQSVKVPGTNGDTVIQSVEGNGVQVTVSDGKYTLSGLDDGEKVSIGGKTYLYRKETQFLEECNNSYPEGSGDGYILTNDGSITLNSDGTPADNTARTMPKSLAEEGALEIICKAVPEGIANTYYFTNTGTRADPPSSAAYTLEKKQDGSYVLVPTGNCTGELPIDARGLTNLTVDFSAGDGKQTLKVDDKTTLTNCTLGTGDVIIDTSGNIITCGSGGTGITMGAGEDIIIQNMTPGTSVTVAPDRKVKVGDTTYNATSDVPLTIGAAADDGTIGLQGGTLPDASGTYTILDNDGKKGDTVTVSGKADISVTNGKATVKGLDSVGEKAVIKDSTGTTTTYEVISPGIVKKVDGDGGISYWRVTGDTILSDTSNPTSSEGPLDGAPVSTQGAEEGTTCFDVKGEPTSDEASKAATLSNNSGRKELEVTKTMELGVQLTGDTVTVKDKGTDTTYVLSDDTSVTAREATFTTQEGVLSDVTGTIKVSSGILDTKDGDSDAKYVLSGEENKVNFLEGSPLSGTSVTTAEGVIIIIRESDNKNTTTVDGRGNITGIDGDAEITGLPGGATVTTTGSGILSLNGKTWKVEGDSDGASFTVDKESSGKLSSVSGLNEGAVISTEDSMTGMTLNGCTLTSAPEGFSYTEGKTQGQGTFSFTHTGDAITLADGTTSCKVNQNQDGVSIGTDGKLTGLSDGEKVTITKGTDTYVYEVIGNTLVTTKTGLDGSQSILTSILPDGETSFTIELGQIKAANGSADASQIREGAAFNAGSTEINAVSTVTNGMMLDRNGKATANRDKLMAEITIEDGGQLLKYTSKKDIHQIVQIGAASKDEWDITTSSQADTVEYGGSKAVSITSGEGNDKITVSGAGEALINGVSGRNTIIHTGTGDATITGGTGNDTIRSAHEGDLISGGGGENTYILSGATTHVTDFAYSMDKAIVTSQAGSLSISGIKTYSEGRIEYTGSGTTSGSLDVSDQDYGGFYAVTLADVDGHNKLNVVWTGTAGGMIDASSRTEKLLLVGSDEGPVDTLIGGQAKDTLIAGEGVSSMWGGAGNDLLISDDDRESTIFFLAGDGYDTVQGFTALAENSLNDADTIDFYGQGITDVKLTQNGIKFYHGQESMLLSGSYDENSMIKWQNGNDKGVAKIGRQGENNSFRYFGEVTNYIGSSGTDTLTIGDTNDNVDIWLDGREGTTYDKIEIIDASQNTGNLILAGGEGANTITGGKGQSSLWGGEGTSKDILNAGSGENTFYYGLNEGNDVINNTKADDKVTLYNLSLSDLKGATIDTSQIIIIQQNGQKLTVNGKAHEFTLADGSTWSADHKTKTWSPVK